LASAAKRRKYGVGYQAQRAVRQRAGYAQANLALKRHVGSKGFGSTVKKAAKYTAIAGAAGATAAGAYGAYRHMSAPRTDFGAPGRFASVSKPVKQPMYHYNGLSLPHPPMAVNHLPPLKPRAGYTASANGMGYVANKTVAKAPVRPPVAPLHDIRPIRRGRGGFRNSLRPGLYH
jgi:hypothetical protein